VYSNVQTNGKEREIHGSKGISGPPLDRGSYCKSRAILDNAWKEDKMFDARKQAGQNSHPMDKILHWKRK
jgi:hypothetical protein